jgi:hypothetical protein
MCGCLKKDLRVPTCAVAFLNSRLDIRIVS